MTDQLEATRSSIVAAVQQELTRFSKQVSAEVQRLRDELASERAARARNEETLRSLAPVLERAQAANQGFQTELQRALESRLADFAGQSKRRHEEIDLRIGRVADEANIGLAAAVESAARPVLKQLEHRQERVETDLANIDRSVRKFDDQAAKMVQHLNVLSDATETRLEEMSTQVTVELDGRLSTLATRVDEISAQAARQQVEVANIVGTRVDQAEDRVNDRIITAEARINETMGQRIADIDAYVGRVSGGLDEAVAMLNDRIAGADARFDEVNRAFDAMHAKLDTLDVDAIDEMKDRVGGLAGEVELVRIEVERFQKSMGDSMDKTVGRIVEIETQMQEQHMDVETAVQLERLEEVERALLMLDPAQFVRRDETPRSAERPTDESASFASPTAALNPLTPPTPFAPQADASY